jgi:hypothetical protein
MKTKIILMAALMMGGVALSGCAPAAGAAGAVVANQAYERETGDRLF